MLATVQYVAKVTFTLRLTLTCWTLSFIAPATTLLKTPYYSHTDNTPGAQHRGNTNLAAKATMGAPVGTRGKGPEEPAISRWE